MPNLNKHWTALENLQYSSPRDAGPCAYITQNIKMYEKTLKLSVFQLSALDNLKQINAKVSSDSPVGHQLGYFILHTLLKIKQNTDKAKSEDSLTQKQVLTIIKSASLVSKLLLSPFIHFCFQSDVVYKQYMEQLKTVSADDKYILLCSCTDAMVEIFKIKKISRIPDGAYLVLEVIASIMTVIYKAKSNADNINLPEDEKICGEQLLKKVELDAIEYEKKLTDFLNHLNKDDVFKSLLLLKGSKNMPPKIDMLFHSQLLLQLNKTGGYRGLCCALVSACNINTKAGTQVCNTISKIIARKGFEKSYYPFIIDEITTFMFDSLKHIINEDEINASVSCLSQLYLLSYEGIKEKIELNFIAPFKVLSNPPDILTGTIIFDNKQFKDLIHINHLAFSASKMSALNSMILKPYLPILVYLYDLVPDNTEQQHQLMSIIIVCLGNCTPDDLAAIIEFLLYDEYKLKGLHPIHPRVLVKYSERTKSYCVQIGSLDETNTDIDTSQTIIKILKHSKNNELIYDVFIILLQLLEQSISLEEPTNQTDLLTENDDIGNYLSHNFRKRYTIINTLSSLITYKPFHKEFNENPRKIIKYTKHILIQNIKKARMQQNNNDDIDELSIIVLTIYYEFVDKLNNNQDEMDLTYILNELEKYTANESLLKQIHDLKKIINEKCIKDDKLENETKFSFARRLCEENEPYLKVNGISGLIEYIGKRDEEIIANKNAILALAMINLRNEESYVFLKSIQLLVALTSLLESQVIDSLIIEYQNEDSIIDDRLKFGEALLKVVEHLGEVSYKYKDQLMNCFINGSKNKNEEFRTSALSNLGSICSLLAYQVHNFFQELLQMIQSIIKTDKYLPARRAAVKILENLLRGIKDLEDFEDYLQPIYNLFKNVLSIETDVPTRLHASNGLEELKKKALEYLFPEQKLEKEIKILNINNENDNTNGTNVKIVELN